MLQCTEFCTAEASKAGPPSGPTTGKEWVSWYPVVFCSAHQPAKIWKKNENAFIHPISELGDPAVSKKKAFSAHTEEDWRRALRLPKRVVHIVSLAGTRHPEQTAGPTASGVTLTPRRHSVTQSVELLTTDDSSKGLQGQQVLRGKSGAYPRTHKPPFFPCVCVIT